MQQKLEDNEHEYYSLCFLLHVFLRIFTSKECWQATKMSPTNILININSPYKNKKRKKKEKKEREDRNGKVKVYLYWDPKVS